jgi:PST family polysaccharide transporter
MKKVIPVWKKIKRNQTILTNFSYLSILQVFTILCPLITYPYLLRVIGTELYGSVIFAQTIIAYISLIINFGFNISATKSIAVHKEDRQILSEIVSSVYTSKFILWLICLAAYLTLISIVPFFRKHFLLYFFSFFVSINELLFPVWFFQGIEKMKYTTFINITIRSLFVIAVFVIIKSRSDYLYVPLLNSIGAMIAGVISAYIVFRKEHIRFLLLPVEKIYQHFRESIPLFVSIISVQVYVNLNKLIVGTFIGMSEVATYDLGEKIATTMKIPIHVINQVVFPKISREKNIEFINKMMFLVTGIVMVGYVCVFICSKWIVLFFMGEFIAKAIDIIRILCISTIIVSINIFLAGCRLIPFGYNKTFMTVHFLNGLFFIIALSGLWLFNSISLYTLAITTVCIEGFCCLQLVYINKKYHLLYVF